MGIIGLIGVAVTLIIRSFQYDTDYFIPVDEIERTEKALANVTAKNQYIGRV